MALTDARQKPAWQEALRIEELMGEHSQRLCVKCGRFGGIRYGGIERPMCIWCFLQQCEEMEIL